MQDCEADSEKILLHLSTKLQLQAGYIRKTHISDESTYVHLFLGHHN